MERLHGDHQAAAHLLWSQPSASVVAGEGGRRDVVMGRRLPAPTDVRTTSK